MKTKRGFLKNYLAAAAIVLVIDLTWVLLVMSEFYNKQLAAFNRPEIVPLWSAVFAWLLIPIGIVVFVDKVSKNQKQAAFYGAIYGLVLYGVYDFTNYASLAGWTLTMVFVDIAWGTFLCSVSSVLFKKVTRRWQK